MRRRPRVVLVAAVLALAVTGLGGCEPGPHPLEIQMSLHRDGVMSEPGPNGRRTVVLSGVARCTRTVGVHLMPKLRQGATVEHTSELSVPCGPDLQEWSRSFELWVDGFVPGAVRVDLEACTNPAEIIDEDCVSLGRTVTFSSDE